MMVMTMNMMVQLRTVTMITDDHCMSYCDLGLPWGEGDVEEYGDDD